MQAMLQIDSFVNYFDGNGGNFITGVLCVSKRKLIFTKTLASDQAVLFEPYELANSDSASIKRCILLCFVAPVRTQLDNMFRSNWKTMPNKTTPKQYHLSHLQEEITNLQKHT